MNHFYFIRHKVFFILTVVSMFVFASCEQSAGPGLQDRNTNLKSISLSAGKLSPAFSPDITSYSTVVNNRIAEITITCAAESSVAKLKVIDGATHTLDEGENSIEVNVTAESGDTKTYMITVTRAAFNSIAIDTKEGLLTIAENTVGDYILTDDITLSNWIPLCSDSASPFSGTFDGGNYTITLEGFDLSSFPADANGCVGIFANAKDALIKNLHIVSAVNDTINKNAHYDDVGAVAGIAKDSVFDNIKLTGSFKIICNHVVYMGGLVGRLQGGELRNSTINADITGENGSFHIGGAVGQFTDGAWIHHTNVNGRIFGTTIKDNIYVGGITGGSYYYFSTEYYGKIEDCYFEGDVRAEGGRMWSWAGGIAATIVGDGNGEGDINKATRIVRCHAKGNVSGESSGWPYIGGIVGYNYYGARVAQCYFIGDVTITGDIMEADYAGGIAGYNSQLNGHNSMIEDCWSSGTVSGFINAGGIVGQNQVFTYLRRCYTTSLITVRGGVYAAGRQSGDGAGGIAGFNQSQQEGAITGCFALNPAITSAGYLFVQRVIGKTKGNPYVAGNGKAKNNYAYSGMSVTINGVPQIPVPNVDGQDGQDCVANPSEAVYKNLGGWDFDNVWEMRGNGTTLYPHLKWEEK
jgi:hypothetical protein